MSRKWYPSNAFNAGVYFGEGLHRRMLLPVVSHSLAPVSLAALFASSINVAETAAIPFGFSAGSLLHFQEQFKLKKHFTGEQFDCGLILFPFCLERKMEKASSEPAALNSLVGC